MDLCLYPPGLSTPQHTQRGEGSQGPAPAGTKGPRPEDSPGRGGRQQAARHLLPRLGPAAWVTQEQDCSHEAVRETLRQRDPTHQV